ncbi:disease resistance protein RPM1-like [Cocos nucifera]|uniref:Disease resistance protein RPM1-like n=1 Tax=Cocos nucifera TaxID=13894 RepID=A0A8K0MXT5_COCNU|nr:disease resistance protein RPM1-like [Cocos nucifera]
MADAAVLLAIEKICVALGREVWKLAGSRFENEISLLTQVPSAMSRIKSEFLVMQAYLHEIEIQTDRNQALEAWVKRVRELAYVVEDIMDDYCSLIAQEQSNRLGGHLKKIFKGSQNLVAWHRIANQLKEVETDLVHLFQMKERWIKMTGEISSSSNYASQKHQNLAMSPRFIEEDELVGIDQNKRTLTGWLTGDDPATSIVSVWGMGGLGKTTLVTNVYNSVKEMFECHAWITISQTYAVDDLLRRMIKELYRSAEKIPPLKKKENVEKIPDNIRRMDHQSLAGTVRRFLEQKKYLIILDDVWDPKAFDNIGEALIVDNKGSRIIITTRSGEVASLAHDSRKLQLEVLQRSDAWDLFCKRAFSKDKRKECPEELKDLGENIVSKCDGLPLAIVSLGSIMSLREKTRSEWQKIVDQLTWELHNNPSLDKMKLALNLSYNHQPGYLKNCFLHCSMFPKDHVLQRKRLIRLWVAEGLVEERGSRTMEEVAEDYLEELINRCMLQVVKRNRFGRIKYWRMNDVVREWAVSLSERENFSTVLQSPQVAVKTADKTRRLSVHGCNNKFEMSAGLPRLRTFIAFDLSGSLALATSLPMLCSNSGYLTVLDLQGIPIERVPDEIGDLFNLRFLGLRETRVKVLPKSLGKLCNLRTLDLMDSEIEKLPYTIRNLNKLRHLFAEKILDPSFSIINNCRGVQAPKGLWNLKDLHTLQAVEANTESVGLLGNLTQLRSFRIWNVRGIHCEKLCASLSKMRYLSKLSLKASDENEILQLRDWEILPQHLLKLRLDGRLAEGGVVLSSFNTLRDSLRELYLGWSGLEEDPLECLSKLPNLVYLTLHKAYNGHKLLFCAGWFPELKQLSLIDMHQLDQVRMEDGTMAGLEILVLNGLIALTDIPQGIEYLKSLKELYLKELHPEFKSRFDESDDRTKIRRIPNPYYVSRSEGQTTYERLCPST